MAAPMTNAAQIAPAQIRTNRMNYARGIDVNQGAQRSVNIDSAPIPNQEANRMDASYELRRARLQNRPNGQPAQNLQQPTFQTQPQGLQQRTTPREESLDPTSDPVYRLKASINQAKEDAKSAASTAVNAAEDQLASQVASKWVAWQWSSIPAILTGAGILDFFAAVLASYVALIRTFVEKPTEGGPKKTILGFSMGILPPAFEFMPGLAPIKSKDLMGMASGFMEFLFFVTAHIILFLLLVLIVVTVVIVALPYILPLIGTGGAITLFFQNA